MQIIQWADPYSNLILSFLLLSCNPNILNSASIPDPSSEQFISWIEQYLQNVYDDMLLHMDLSYIEDPDHPGTFLEYRFFASYQRSVKLTEYDDAHITLRIQRIRPVHSNGPTHAILPSFLCPWRQYPLPALIDMIRLLFQNAGIVSKTAREAAVWPNQLRSIKNSFPELEALSDISFDTPRFLHLLAQFIRSNRRTWIQTIRSFGNRVIYAGLIEV